MKKEALAVTIIGGSIAAAIALRYIQAKPQPPEVEANGGAAPNDAASTEGYNATVTGSLIASDPPTPMVGLGNVDITILHMGSVIGTGKTNSNGDYSISIPTANWPAGGGSIPPHGDYELQVAWPEIHFEA